MNLDLRMRHSQFMDSFEWVSKDGFCANFPLLQEEFALYRGLMPIRVSIFGPPMSGKNILTKKIKSALKVPKMDIKEVIDYVRMTHKESEVAHLIHRKEEEIKDKIIEEH